uniref:Glycoside hydrolase family 42 N-terminal domain-containing protein n=1 Tax=Arsenophonus endosymbiont of Trialeurodes vaporariorum TaxID=235567 RepID=A0A3B0LVQ3_9GAMM
MFTIIKKLMRKKLIIIAVSLTIATPLSTLAKEPKNYIYTSAGDFESVSAILARSDIHGVQIVYNWRMLEPEKDKYDFSKIEKDLAHTKQANKKLFIQIQDRFFEPNARYVPDYLLNEPVYNGGLSPQFDNSGEGDIVGSGWVARQWDPVVRHRYQALLAALAKRFDGQVYGINLPTAIDLDEKAPPKGFTCDNYFASEIANLAFARKVFTKSHVVQYVNFWPCEWNNDKNYMSRLFKFASVNNIGLGGPDIVPNRKAQMKNSYPFFNKYKNKLTLVAMAVQEPTLTYINKKTGKPFSKAEFVQFAENYLGADIIFGSKKSPWLAKK